MEYVVGILYHKIMESDFTNMFAIKKPKGGGGQTYIQAAGYSQEDLDTMFNESDIIRDTAEFWDDAHTLPKKDYTIKAYTIDSSICKEIELSPRTNRKDYRICRQNPKHRHPAWSKEYGFPEPNKKPDGTYLYEKGYPSLIDYLYILIIKTVNNKKEYKYYAWYLNSDSFPKGWPKGIGLENIFLKSNSQGILLFDNNSIRFHPEKDVIISAGSLIDEQVDYMELPEDINESSTDVVELSDNDISISFDINNLVVTKEDPPARSRRKKAGQRSKNSPKKRSNKSAANLKEIGDKGEQIAIKIEKQRLIAAGYPELAKKIIHVSKDISEDEGYDIKSFSITESGYEDRYIEVKTTTGIKSKPFDISVNEVNKSEELGEKYYIYRIFGLTANIKSISYYEINGSVADNFILEPTSYKASCK